MGKFAEAIEKGQQWIDVLKEREKNRNAILITAANEVSELFGFEIFFEFRDESLVAMSRTKGPFALCKIVRDAHGYPTWLGDYMDPFRWSLSESQYIEAALVELLSYASTVRGLEELRDGV